MSLPKTTWTPQRIHDLREFGLRMTQEEMAERVGVKRRTLQHWETGDRRPRGPALLVLDQLDAMVAARRPKPAGQPATEYAR